MSTCIYLDNLDCCDGVITKTFRYQVSDDDGKVIQRGHCRHLSDDTWKFTPDVDETCRQSTLTP